MLIYVKRHSYGARQNGSGKAREYANGAHADDRVSACVPGVADAAAPFTGTPGTTTCIGESHTALAQKYGNLVAAANVRRLPTR